MPQEHAPRVRRAPGGSKTYKNNTSGEPHVTRHGRGWHVDYYLDGKRKFEYFGPRQHGDAAHDEAVAFSRRVNRPLVPAETQPTRRADLHPVLQASLAERTIIAPSQEEEEDEEGIQSLHPALAASLAEFGRGQLASPPEDASVPIVLISEQPVSRFPSSPKKRPPVEDFMPERPLKHRKTRKNSVTKKTGVRREWGKFEVTFPGSDGRMHRKTLSDRKHGGQQGAHEAAMSFADQIWC
jgi:hypothetical protein